MIKRFAVLLVAVALIAAACGSSDEAETTTTAADSEATPPAQEGGSTLEAVQARGELICGVSGTAVGFSELGADGVMTGFDADYCRAIAAAVLGDSTKVQFRSLTAAERFEALKNNAIDVLVRNTTWTQSRDADIGLQFVATTYYDGQQMLASTDALPGLTGDSSFEAIDGAIVCTSSGTTSEKNISEGAAVAGVTIQLETVETFAEAFDKFLAGTCDVVTTDGSGLFGRKSAAIAAGDANAENWVIFPTAPFSKEPLGPVVRQGDDPWYDIVQWVVFATFIADENGVTSANVDDMMDATPELTRLFGGEGEVQTAMGLSADAFLNVIKQVGNYGELYEKNLTGPLELARVGTFNAQWYDGGLIYAPPAR